MERTITVNGRGKIYLKPDTAIFHILLKNYYSTYKLAMDSSAKHVHEIGEILLALGIDKTLLKTSNMSIRAKESFVYDENGKRTREKIKEYYYDVSLTLKIDLDLVLVGKVLGKLAKLSFGVETRLSVGVKDETKAKEMVRESAVNNAIENATALAKSAGVELGEVITINADVGRYDRSDIFENSICNYDVIDGSDDDYDTDDYFEVDEFNSDDIICYESITMVFAIK